MSIQDKKPETQVLEDDGLVVVPTPEYVKNSIKEAIEEHAQSRNHPYATQTEPGFVTLSNETDSDSEITAATSRAVKAANDNANTRLAKDQNGADISNKEEFVKNLPISLALKLISPDKGFLLIFRLLGTEFFANVTVSTKPRFFTNAAGFGISAPLRNFSSAPLEINFLIASDNCASLFLFGCIPAAANALMISRWTLLNHGASNNVGGTPAATFPFVNSPLLSAVFVTSPIFCIENSHSVKVINKLN